MQRFLQPLDGLGGDHGIRIEQQHVAVGMLAVSEADIDAAGEPAVALGIEVAHAQLVAYLLDGSAR